MVSVFEPVYRLCLTFLTSCSSTFPFSLSSASAVSTRCLKWPPPCWSSMVRRTKSSTSLTVWPCTSAAPVPLSPCGWREPATMTSNCTPSTWRDSSSSSPSNSPPPEEEPSHQARVHLSTFEKPPPHHLPEFSVGTNTRLESTPHPLLLSSWSVWRCDLAWTGGGGAFRWLRFCWAQEPPLQGVYP